MEEIFSLLRQADTLQYGDEPVNQLQHALQCAYLAEQEGATSSLIVACLLHDIGHLVQGGDAGFARRGIDACHEERGARFLSRWFGESVTLPVRLHVDAKRYLCATEADYFASLSAGSVRSLEVQGGMFAPEQLKAFLNHPYAQEGLALRRWDERAKVPSATTPSLQHFEPYIQQHLQAN
jgi:phosphonate degradation associated HDIG domain protein